MPAQNILYFTDLNCENITEFLTKASNKHLFSSPNKWLMITQDEYHSNSINQRFSHLNLSIDSNVILAFRLQETDQLYTIYKTNQKENYVEQSFIPNWNGIQFTNQLKMRRNFQRKAFRACFVITNNDTFSHLDDYRFKHVDTPTKASYLLMNHLVDYLNGTREYSFVDSWGYSQNGRLFNGMIGVMQRGEVDIGGTVAFMTAERIPIVDYIPVCTPSFFEFVFRQPPLSYVTNVFLLPFSMGVWITFIALILIVSIILYYIVKLEWKRSDLVETELALRESFFETLLFTISGVTQQGYASEPRSDTGRLIMTFSFLTLMFLYVSYSAGIIVLLQSSATNIQTLEDLLNSRLKLAADDVVYNRYYFQSATEPIHKAIYEQKVAPPGQKPNFVAMEDGVKRIRQGFYAFHMETSAGYKLVSDTFLESEKCGLQEINYLQVFEPYMSLPKNSSYKEMIKIGFRRICEVGIHTRELRKLHTKKPECNQMGGKFVSVGMIDMYPAFMVLVFGMALSIILNIIENIIDRQIVVKKRA